MVIDIGGLVMKTQNLIFIIFIIAGKCIFAKEALVIKPVIDCVSQSTYFDNKNNYLIPLSPIDKKNADACPRRHQLLFNEIVNILENKSKEVTVEIPNLFFKNQITGKKNNSLLTLKANLIPLEELEKKGLDISKIPKPINYNLNNINNRDQKILTLTFPFYDKLTKKKYSAGTRFVYENFNTELNSYSVFVFDPITFSIIKTNIPNKISITNEEQDQLSSEEKISNYINLVKKWANFKNGYIPYVWGGCSLKNLCKDKIFEKGNVAYTLPSFIKNPKTGFDCSGLILRATQIYGLPYYFKNSYTAAEELSSLKKDEEIENGDLIYINGHIIIISDIEKNLCVEARDYSQGYGKIQEIELQNIFNGIDSFAKLKQSYLINKSLGRLDINKNIVNNTKIKILKMRSAFEKTKLD
jgi:hypothetical protein